MLIVTWKNLRVTPAIFTAKMYLSAPFPTPLAEMPQKVHVIANRNTESRTASSLSCTCTAMADGFEQEITKLYEAREQERETRRLQASLSPQRGRRLANISLERFRTSIKYQDRPAAADIAFCVAAYANGVSQDRIERALEDDYLFRDPSTSKRAAYIRRTMEKARRWAER